MQQRLDDDDLSIDQWYAARSTVLDADHAAMREFIGSFFAERLPHFESQRVAMAMCVDDAYAHRRAKLIADRDRMNTALAVALHY